MFSRDKRTLLTDWWFTVDRELLAAFLLLLGAGIALSFAASPAVAEAHNWGENLTLFIQNRALRLRSKF